jgi:hypothetical protein
MQHVACSGRGKRQQAGGSAAAATVPDKLFTPVIVPARASGTRGLRALPPPVLAWTMPCADVLTKRCGGTTMSDGREETRV